MGLIGNPLKHTISPAFQQAAFDYYGLEAQYQAVELAASELPNFIKDLRAKDAYGVNVTIPYKETVIPFLDSMDSLSATVGAVNTIVSESGKLVGYNTDVQGFGRALLEEAGFDAAGKRVVLLGAGGAAKAVVVALLDMGVASLVVVNRHNERGETLIRRFENRAKATVVSALPWDLSSLAEALRECDMVVNATSLGLKTGESPLPKGLIPSKALIYDLIYNPPATQLLVDAKECGSKTLNGLPMLVYQGAASFEIWTGKKAPVDVMMRAAEVALEKMARERV